MDGTYQISPADKRQAILEAAQHVFAESGFHTSTMDAVLTLPEWPREPFTCTSRAK